MMISPDGLIRSASVALLLGSFAAPVAAQAPEYTVIDMGPGPAALFRPAVYQCPSGATTSCPPIVPTITNGTAIVFSSQTFPSNFTPYYWESGAAQPIPIAAHSDDITRAVAMSTNGFVVGTEDGGVARGYRWSRATGRFPFDPPDSAYPLGVNAAGLVVGQDSRATIRAVMWNVTSTQGYTPPIYLDDLNIVGKSRWVFNTAYAITDGGVIAGIGTVTTASGTAEPHNFFLIPSGGGGGAMNRSTWTVTATESSPTDPPSNAIDGNLGTRFSTGRAQHDSQGFHVSWNGDVTIGRIRMEVGPSTNDYPRTCGIWVKDTAGHVTFVNCAADANGNVDVTFAPVPASTIEVWQWGTASSWWSIAEFNVYKQ